MGYYQIHRQQILNSDIETIWDFASDTENLKKITPPEVGFEILSKSSMAMEEGMIIIYKISPILNIPTSWITEISHVVKHKCFVDTQLYGPYKFWHHQHKFDSIESGQTRMTDIITYETPFGIVGDIANALFLKSKLNKIFDHRTKVLDQMFN